MRYSCGAAFLVIVIFCRATRLDLFAHLTAEQRRHISTKPSQGVFAFSTAFPHLSEMGDDSLIAAAHAVRVATKYLGRKMSLPNYDAIKRDVAKAYPNASAEDVRVKTNATGTVH